MTKEEAILCLKGIKNYGRDTFTEQSDWQESLDMAIKALSLGGETMMNREERRNILQNRYKAYKRLPKKHKKAMNISLQILQQQRRRIP